MNNALPHPPHSPNHGALVLHLSGLAFSVGAQSGGRSEAHPWPGSSWHSPRDHNPGRWSRAERAERAGAAAGRPREPQAPRRPFPKGSQRTTWAPRPAQRPRPQQNHPPKPKTWPHRSPTRPGEQKLSSSSGEVGGGLTPGSPRSPPVPAGRLEAVSPPAGLGARTGASPGTAGPARLQAVGEAGGRALRGREQTGPCPSSAEVAVGASWD